MGGGLPEIESLRGLRNLSYCPPGLPLMRSGEKELLLSPVWVIAIAVAVGSFSNRIRLAFLIAPLEWKEPRQFVFV
jgi:hypothetical protein